MSRCLKHSLRPGLMRVAAFGLCALGLGLPVHRASGAPPATALHGSVQHATVGVMRLGFAHMSENDARAAIIALTKQLSVKLGYEVACQIEVFDAPNQLRDACRAGQIQLILAGTWDYLTMEISDLVQNLYVAQTGGLTAHAWRLMVRRDGPFHALAELRGHRVLVLHNGMAHLGLPWFETLCLARGLGPAGVYFRQVETTTKPSGALLPVFFGKADACVVDDDSLDLVAQLNPQVPAQLATLETSDALSNAVVCLTRRGWRNEQIRDDIARILGTLHDEPAGQQILTMFRCERLVTCSPHQLDSVLQLFQLSHRLRPSSATP